MVTPNWPRWKVTLIAGGVTTLIACSPFVFTKLLDFVGVYGLLLMPVGAIVFVEHWVFPRIGFTRFWASRKGLVVSWPALVAWLGSVALAVVAWQSGWILLFFLAIPVWLLTAVLYTILTTREYPPDDPEAFRRSNAASAGVGKAFREIITGIGSMPATMRQLALVQFFTWFALFCMWIYFVPAVATHVFGGAPGSPEYQEGVEWGGVCFSVYNGTAFAFSFLLVALVKHFSARSKAS